MPDFCHLHCHTQFSLLDGAADIDSLFQKAKADGQKAVAITDHGNMFGAFKFFASGKKHDVKPIIGCEVYVVADHTRKEFKGGKKDKRYHQLLLAKNAQGYKNLSRICSLGFIEGVYRTFPRVTKEIISKYSEGIIATSCCIGAEVPQAIIFKGEEEGERVLKEWLDIFGEDYYIELQRHHIENIDGTGVSQEDVNQVLLKLAKKHNIKVIATNDSHYVDQGDSEAHDILLCLQTGNDISSENRFKFPNDQFFFKTKAQMGELFKDVPFALDNTLEIADKIEMLNLKRDIMLPNFGLPKGFKNEDDFLKHLSFEGAKLRYDSIDAEVESRINHELEIIRKMGFAGYFLITQDLIQAAKDLGVAVGPGRGSAAGSAVAFCTGITNIDPIRYNLLFERFLNPERVSMPDIDIDFDDEGRQSVIDYCIDKYGKNQVAQIITYGTMAARSAVRDVGRVLRLPLQDTDKIAKLIPEGPKVKLKESIKTVPELNDLFHANGLEARTLDMAQSLEGSVRHRGIHAAGVIIAPTDLLDCVPVCTAKDSDLWVTQFDGRVVEDAGMLKMDFLGLKTLSIIKDAITNVHERHGGEKIDPDEIPLDDEKTYELFQRGETVGVFQFESEGMQMYMKELKPTNIEDLIAMNALYRPGPMDYIPEFIDRKHGRKPIQYPHEWLEDLLKPSNGIMVYQEQIMQTAQIMAGYSLGEADLLRRAMGKKKLSEMAKHREIFKEGATKKDVPEKKSMEIFDVMEKFAAYGFNRSHSAAYSVLAFQTAYLKAHYPAEYMAAVLTHNMKDIKQVNFFLNECNRMGLTALVPDINESKAKFMVNDKGEIRFGLNAVKGVGAAAVESLIEERITNGHYESIFNLTERVNQRTVNRKCLENMCMAGAFDSFTDTHRAQYLTPDTMTQATGVEKAIKYGQSMQREAASSQASLFAAAGVEDIPKPELPEVEEWSLMEKLTKEREVTGIYLSGHPLNNYKLAIDCFCNGDIEKLSNSKDTVFKFAAIVTSANERISKNGDPFGTFTIEDLTSSMQFMLFKEDYLRNANHLQPGLLLYMSGLFQPRWRGADQYAFKIKDIKLLSELSSDARNIVINVASTDIDTELIDQLESIFTEYPGKLNVRFIIQDREHLVELFSQKYTLSSNPEALQQLQDISKIRFKLSTAT